MGKGTVFEIEYQAEGSIEVAIPGDSADVALTQGRYENDIGEGMTYHHILIDRTALPQVIEALQYAAREYGLPTERD